MEQIEIYQIRLQNQTIQLLRNLKHIKSSYREQLCKTNYDNEQSVNPNFQNPERKEKTNLERLWFVLLRIELRGEKDLKFCEVWWWGPLYSGGVGQSSNAYNSLSVCILCLGSDGEWSVELCFLEFNKRLRCHSGYKKRIVKSSWSIPIGSFN